MSSFLRTIRLVLAQPTRFPNSPEMKNALASASENDWMATKQSIPKQGIPSQGISTSKIKKKAVFEVGGRLSARSSVLLSSPPEGLEPPT